MNRKNVFNNDNKRKGKVKKSVYWNNNFSYLWCICLPSMHSCDGGLLSATFYLNTRRHIFRLILFFSFSARMSSRENSTPEKNSLPWSSRGIKFDRKKNATWPHLLFLSFFFSFLFFLSFLKISYWFILEQPRSVREEEPLLSNAGNDSVAENGEMCSPSIWWKLRKS